VRRSKFFWICLGVHLQNVFNLVSFAIINQPLLILGFNNNITCLSISDFKSNLRTSWSGALVNVNLQPL